MTPHALAASLTLAACATCASAREPTTQHAPPPIDYPAAYASIEAEDPGPPRDEERTRAFVEQLESLRQLLRSEETRARIAVDMGLEITEVAGPFMSYAERPASSIPSLRWGPEEARRDTEAATRLLDLYLGSPFPAFFDRELQRGVRLPRVSSIFAGPPGEGTLYSGMVLVLAEAEEARLRRALATANEPDALQALSNLAELHRLPADEVFLTSLTVNCRTVMQTQESLAQAVLDGTLTAATGERASALQSAFLRHLPGAIDRGARWAHVSTRNLLARVYEMPIEELPILSTGLKQTTRGRWIDHATLSDLAETYSDQAYAFMVGPESAPRPVLPWDNSDWNESRVYSPLGYSIPPYARVKNSAIRAAHSAAAMMIHIEIAGRLRDGQPLPTEIAELDTAQTINDIASPLVGDASRFTIETAPDAPGGYRLLMDGERDLSLPAIADWRRLR